MLNWISRLSDVGCVLARAPSSLPSSLIYNSPCVRFGKAFAPFFYVVRSSLRFFFRLKQNCNCGREPLVFRRSPWNNQICLFYETVKLALSLFFCLNLFLLVCLFVVVIVFCLCVVVFTRLFVCLLELCLDAAPHEVIPLVRDGESYSCLVRSFVRCLFCLYCFGFVFMQHPTKRVDLTRLRESFTRSVVRRMMTDVPWGVLLSGKPSFHANSKPTQTTTTVNQIKSNHSNKT